MLSRLVWGQINSSASFNCEFIVGWLSWQQEETLSIWTITVAMETKFLFSINNLAGKCVSIESLNVLRCVFWGGEVREEILSSL